MCPLPLCVLLKAREKLRRQKINNNFWKPSTQDTCLEDHFEDLIYKNDQRSLNYGLRIVLSPECQLSHENGDTEVMTVSVLEESLAGRLLANARAINLKNLASNEPKLAV